MSTVTENSPEVQDEIRGRTELDNHLLMLDKNIKMYFDRAAKNGKADEYNEDLATAHALVRFRQVSIETDSRLNGTKPAKNSRKNEDEISASGIPDAAWLVICSLVFLAGVVLGIVVF